MLRFPPDITIDDFVAEYWQRRPLLLRNALVPQETLTAEELAGLACEDGVESRIVLEQGNEGPWEVQYGPFDAEDFTRLPASHWTLLVQDVDKWIPEVGEILESFRFLPDWRIDDVMISYATDKGSVGPHTDDYDVFLIQTSGERRWQIEDQPVSDAPLLPDLDLRILKSFEPDQEWVLEPGDVLYLPPKIAHWGIAVGPCLTWSVGFRAPSSAEMAISWLEHQTNRVPDARYRDPAPAVMSHPGEVSLATVSEARRLCREMLETDDAEFGRWFTGYISEPKDHVAPLQPETSVSPDALVERIQTAGVRLIRAPGARLLFHRYGDRIILAASGHLYDLPADRSTLVMALCDRKTMLATELSPWVQDSQAIDLLAALINEGQLELINEPS